MRPKYIVRELPPYQSDPRVIQDLLNGAAANGYHLEWIIPVGGRALRWAGVFVRGGYRMYEYHVEQFPPYASDVRMVEQRLNRLHKEGWDLVDVLVMGRRGAHVVGIFRRELSEHGEQQGEEVRQRAARSAGASPSTLPANAGSGEEVRTQA